MYVSTRSSLNAKGYGLPMISYSLLYYEEKESVSIVQYMYRVDLQEHGVPPAERTAGTRHPAALEDRTSDEIVTYTGVGATGACLYPYAASAITALRISKYNWLQVGC
jgi:hypothetical protein